MEISEKFKVNFGSEESMDRNKIMHISTQIESGISDLLNMSIGDYERKSVSFGYSSNALSLAARINLLIDFNIFTSDEKRYFMKFMEIRNKFAHNHMVKSLHNFLLEERKQETLKFLENQFKNHIENYEVSESNSWELYILLVGKIEDALTKLFHQIAINAGDIGKSDYRNSFCEEFDKMVADLSYIKSLKGNSQKVIADFYTELNLRAAKRQKTEEEVMLALKNKILF